MQIPLTLPEQTTPLPNRRDIQALSPVSPVPGVEGLAETLDPRLALQWTQPVLGDQSADLARSVLESVATPTPAAGTSPPPSSGAAALSWSSLAQVLGPLLQRIADSPASPSVPWPAEPVAIRPDASEADTPVTAFTQGLQSLRHQLAQSDLFAAHHLARQWFAPPSTLAYSTVSHPAQMLDASTLSRWMSALSPESPTAEDITRLLLNGQMHWQGELLPGIAVTLNREDAWREDPEHPGQAQKGAALRAEMQLPQSGRITVLAYQWGAHIDLRVIMPSSPESPLHAAWSQLQDRLSALNLPDLQVTHEAAP